jgi:hypothetical protein
VSATPALALLRFAACTKHPELQHVCCHHSFEEYVPVKKRRAMEEAKLRQLRGVRSQGRACSS